MNEIVYKKIMNYATLAQKMAKSFRIVIIHTLYKKIMNYATLAQNVTKSFRIVIIHTLYKKYSEK